MEEIKITSSGNNGGALFIGKEIITGKDIIVFSFANKQGVLDFHKKINKFVADNYGEV